MTCATQMPRKQTSAQFFYLVQTTLIVITSLSSQVAMADQGLQEASVTLKKAGLKFANYSTVSFISNIESLVLLREDRYEPDALIMTGKDRNGSLYKVFPGEAPELWVDNFENVNHGNIIDIAQYDKSKTAFTVSQPDNCIKEYDSVSRQVTVLVGICQSNTPGDLQHGIKVNATDFALEGPEFLVVLEKSRKLIFSDGSNTSSIYSYDLNTKELELLVRNDQLTNPLSLIASSDERIVYISHQSGLSEIKLDTQEISPIEWINTGSEINSPIGQLQFLRWIITDSLMTASHNHSLLMLDILSGQSYSTCNIAGTSTASEGGTTCPPLQVSGLAVIHHQIFMTTDDSQSLHSVTLRGENSTSTCCGSVGTTFGELHEMDVDFGTFATNPIDILQEDRYKPGSFLFNDQMTIKRWTPGQPVENYIGDENDKDLTGKHKDGNSSVAQFSLISGFVQFNDTMMAIADFQNACVRLYDSATDMVSSIIGACKYPDGEVVPTVNWNLHNKTEVRSFTQSTYSAVSNILLLEKKNILLAIDHSLKLKIIASEFNSQTSRVIFLDEIDLQPLNMIADSGEDNIFINHKEGVSLYSFHTQQTTRLFGRTDEFGRIPTDFKSGPFSVAQPGDIGIFQWLISDQLLITTGVSHNEALLLIDLQQEYVYAICQGNENNTDTLRGTLDVCELNTPTTLTVTSTGSVLVTTLNVSFNDWDWGLQPFVWTLPFQAAQILYNLVSSCTGEDNAQEKEIIYYQEEKTMTCIDGYELDEVIIRQCDRNNVSADYAPVPGCRKGEVVKSPSGPVSESPLLSDTQTILIFVGLSIFIAVVIIVGVIMLAKRQKEKANEIIGAARIWDRLDGDLKEKVEKVLTEPKYLTLLDRDPIGHGNFGEIFIGELHKGEEIQRVAVKTVIANQANHMSLESVQSLLREAVMLQGYNHPNIMTTEAIVMEPYHESPKVVLPYMANKDLRSLIRRENQTLLVSHLLHYAMQVACGMEYLSENKFVHRDLAARNCLVSDDYLVKIGDFGLSKDVYKKIYYRRGVDSETPLPQRWMAPESLLPDGEFNSKTDVWSFGVLVWELFTRGELPYSNVNNRHLREHLLSGYRLERPTGVPDSACTFMDKCWSEDPEERPTFSELHEYLNKILRISQCQSCNRNFPVDNQFVHLTSV